MYFRSILLCSLSVCISLSFGGCGQGSEEPNTLTAVPIPDELKRVAEADPAIDVRSAIATNDLRFISIRRYTVTVPGVTNFHEAYEAKIGVKIIPGTSDVISSLKQANLQRAATRYAAKYNELLLEHIQRNPTLTNKVERSHLK